jgi:hypothetical protein
VQFRYDEEKKKIEVTGTWVSGEKVYPSKMQTEPRP